MKNCHIIQLIAYFFVILLLTAFKSNNSVLHIWGHNLTLNRTNQQIAVNCDCCKDIPNTFKALMQKSWVLVKSETGINWDNEPCKDREYLQVTFTKDSLKIQRINTFCKKKNSSILMHSSKYRLYKNSTNAGVHLIAYKSPKVFDDLNSVPFDSEKIIDSVDFKLKYREKKKILILESWETLKTDTYGKNYLE